MPGRVVPHGAEGGVDGAAGAVVGMAADGAGLGDQQPRNPSTESHFEHGSSSNQGGRAEVWREDGFGGQGFGGSEEGYYEGNDGYGNGDGLMNRGNYHQRPYRQQYVSSNRGCNSNNYRRGYNRFNNGGNRYQRSFNNNENPIAIASA